MELSRMRALVFLMTKNAKTTTRRLNRHSSNLDGDTFDNERKRLNNRMSSICNLLFRKQLLLLPLCSYDKQARDLLRLSSYRATRMRFEATSMAPALEFPKKVSANKHWLATGWLATFRTIIMMFGHAFSCLASLTPTL